MLKCTVVLVAIFIFSTEADIVFRNPVSPVTKDYDTVVVVLGWPVTTFKIGETKVKPASCPNPADNLWNLHGLWPVKSKGQSPAFCDDAAAFDVSILEPKLLKRMENQWPPYNAQPTNVAFWNSVWREHGTCATMSPSLQGQQNYFKRSMEVLDKYNVAPLFNNEKIKPGGSYDLNKIVASVKKYYKVEPILTCVNLKDENDKNQYLYEIMLCSDLNVDLISCPASMKHKCIMDQPAVFPKC